MVEAATETLERLDIDTVAVIEGDLHEGCREEAPFDVILIDGMVDAVPEAFTGQLKPDGRLVTFVRGAHNAIGASAAHIFRRSGIGGLTSHCAFNGTAPLLPGFARDQAFVF